MLLLLGVQLAQVKITSVLPRATVVAGLKLILPPLLSWGLTAALGIHGLLRAVLIIEGSTPTAVNALLLALQYDRRPDLTASILLLTTVGNLVTMTVLLTLLREFLTVRGTAVGQAIVDVTRAIQGDDTPPLWRSWLRCRCSILFQGK